MTWPNRNVLWATAVGQELARSGVRDVVVAPGSRSAPLVLACHAQKGVRITTHLDERAAGFFALGIGKATGRPAAVVVTSGTAVANLLPAVVEASQGRVPLLVLTADRPPELRDVGANQAIDQHGIFGPYPRFFADAGIPEPLPERIRHLRALVCRAVAMTRSGVAGPTHLNLPFREPLEPRAVAGDVPKEWASGDAEAEHGRADAAPFLATAPSVVQPDPAAVADLAARMREPDGIIVAGPMAPSDEVLPLVAELGRRTGYPVLADPLSGLRYGAPDGTVLSAYDSFLAHAPTRTTVRPRVVLRLGATPTSKSLLALLAGSADAYQAVVDDTGRLGEETSRANLVLACAPAAFLRMLLAALPRGPRPSAWAEGWTRLERTTRSILERELQKRRFEGVVAARLLASLPEGAVLFVSNSLPIRDVDRFALGSAKRIRVLANRGASGIDGVPSTALGVAHALGRRVTLLLGDLAFLHDLSGLATARRRRIPLDVVLVNNDGGGIFHLLPIARHDPPFTDLFATPHGLDLGAVAKALGLGHRRLPLGKVPDAIPSMGARGGVLEVVSDRRENAAQRRAVEAAVAQALDQEAETHAR